MRWRAKRTKRRGGAVAELAVAAPVFAFIILGQIETSRLGMAAQLIATAAREGCRVAVINGSTNTGAASGLDVQYQVNTMLAPLGLSTMTVSAVDSDPGTNGAFVMPSTWSTAAGGTAITVLIRVPYSSLSWLPSPYFMKNATVVASATMTSERP
jgi:Flp pilus assembly protein TadG